MLIKNYLKLNFKMIRMINKDSNLAITIMNFHSRPHTERFY